MGVSGGRDREERLVEMMVKERGMGDGIFWRGEDDKNTKLYKQWKGNEELFATRDLGTPPFVEKRRVELAIPDRRYFFFFFSQFPPNRGNRFPLRTRTQEAKRFRKIKVLYLVRNVTEIFRKTNYREKKH